MGLPDDASAPLLEVIFNRRNLSWNFRYRCDMCETDNRRTRAVIYLRADRRGLPGIDVQRTHTARYINARPTWELVDEYVDEAKAKHRRRKAAIILTRCGRHGWLTNSTWS